MKDKVVIITGASGGIGEALARKFSREKSKVVLAARDSAKLAGVAESLKQSGCIAKAVACDVSMEENCRRLVQETIAEFGRIDVLINNAGISMRALFNDADLEVIKSLMNVNFWGTVFCTKHALPYLLKSKGSLVGISSIAGKIGLPGRAGYSASKFAMEGFLETLRTENMGNGLHVLVACPGFTASDIRKNALAADGSQQGESPRNEGRMMSADEVASHVYRAVLNRKRDLVLTGNGRLTVLLSKFFPSLTDKLVFKHMSEEKDSPIKPVK